MSSPVLGPLLTTVLDVVASGVVVILAQVANRLTRRPTWGWCAAAAAAYTFLVLPTDAAFAGIPDAAVVIVLRLAVLAVAAATVLVAVRARWRVRYATAAAALAAPCLMVVAAETGLLDPVLVTAIATGPVIDAALVGFAAIAAAAILTACRRSAPRSTAWIGVGVVLVGVAHGQQWLAGRDVLVGRVVDPPAALMHLAGLIIVAIGLLDVVHRASDTMMARCAVLEQQLAQVGLTMAERDHELRNGLTGLAGLPELIESPPPALDRVSLGGAIRSELGRLAVILDGSEIVGTYPLHQLVSDVVALHGPAVRTAVPKDLRVVGRRAHLGQVLANLLANCARHAPEADVLVRAERSPGGRVTLEVLDTGPGMHAQMAGSLFEAGVSGVGSTGLGLAICRDLLAAEGASIAAENLPGAGFVARVELREDVRVPSS